MIIPRSILPRRFAWLPVKQASVAALALFMIVVIPTASLADKKHSLGIPGVRGGVVTTSEPVAAQVGADILRNGGNAIDAAAAVAFALNVIEPQSSGIGGGGFMIIHNAKRKKTIVVDSRERTPAAGDKDMFLDSNSEPFSFSIRSTSGIGVGVPGTVRGIELALEQEGTMTLSEVLQPAIKLAEEGHRVSSRLEQSILSSRLDSEPGNPAYDEARKVFRPGGVPLVQNNLLVQPDLAKTLKKIANEGADAFYTGEIAEKIVETQLNTRDVPDSDQPLLMGRMTEQDLADYEVSVREPVSDYYRDFEIVSMPPPSSGGLTVIQVLKLIERFPIGDAEQGFGFGSTRTLNVMMEAMRLAFADRAVWMGDTDFVSGLPVNGLIDDDYIATRTVLIDPDSRQSNVEAGDPRPFDDDLAMVKKDTKLAMGKKLDAEGINTTHFTVVDSDGNVVTYTNTIESAWGTGLMVPGFGFLLNNELTDFNREPTFNPDPDNFDPGANDAAPFKRPRSSMAPTLVFRKNKPVAAYGSPGGSTIINSVVNVTLNLIDHEYDVQEAVDLPRISQTSANGSPGWEAGFDQDVIDELKAPPFGHNLSDGRLQVIGSVQAIVIDKDKQQYGAADRRRIGGIVSLSDKRNKRH